MEPRFEDIPSFSLTGLAMKCSPAKTSEIPGLWRALRPRLEEIARVDDVTFGVCYDFSPEGFTYLAGAEAEADSELPEDMTTLAVPDQHYAIFTHELKGRPLPETLPATINYIFKTWLPASGYAHTGGPELERYDSRFGNKDWSGSMEILVPVKKQD